MNGVVAPVSPGDSGQRVADLQAALQALIERRAVDGRVTGRDDQEERFREEAARQMFGPATEALVARFRRTRRLGDGGAVDDETAAAVNKLLEEQGLLGGPDDERRVSRGRIIGAGAGALVRVYAKRLRSEEPLGEATTNASGEYEFAYAPADLDSAGKETVDLRVALLNDAREEVASTPVIFNAAPEEGAPDLALGDGVEYEGLTAELRPRAEGVAFEELTPDDAAFLSGQTGVEAERITWLAEATRRARDSLKPISADALYGLFRKGVEPEALLRTPP